MRIGILTIPDQLESLSEKVNKPKSSFVKNFARKNEQRLTGSIPIDTQMYGNIQLSWVYDSESKLYRCIWKSRLSNSVTTINRLGLDKYLVSRTAPNMEAQSYMFADKEPAIRAFFVNTDIYRLPDKQCDEARKWCSTHLKNAEGLKSIYFNAKTTKAAQSRFNKTVLVGSNKQFEGKLLAVDFTGKKVKVQLLDPKTKKFGTTKTVSSDIVWYE